MPSTKKATGKAPSRPPRTPTSPAGPRSAAKTARRQPATATGPTSPPPAAPAQTPPEAPSAAPAESPPTAAAATEPDPQGSREDARAEAAAHSGEPGAPASASTPKPAGARGRAGPGALAVREDETPWTEAELTEVRAQLQGERDRLVAEIDVAQHDLADLLRDSGDGAGDDQADAGTKTFEREHEMSLANNARDMLVQADHALARIEDGTYGICESCGNPIGKLRLQAFPRATLCVTCKQREERR